LGDVVSDVVIYLADLPDVLSALRLEMSKLLLEAAMDEDRKIADRLREIALAFEIGDTSGG
jgi:hypothetical protein